MLLDRLSLVVGYMATAASQRVPEVKKNVLRAPRVTRLEAMQAASELKQLVQQLDCGLTTAATDIVGARTHTQRDETVDYNDAGRALLATAHPALRGKANLDEIWRHPCTGARVFVGNREAACDGTVSTRILGKTMRDAVRNTERWTRHAHSRS